MKKIVLALSVLLFAFVLIACTENEGPDTLDIEIFGLAGEGTVQNPYILNVNQGEKAIKKIETSDDTVELEFIFGSISSNKFKAASKEQAEVSVTEEGAHYLNIKTNSDAAHYALRVKGKNLSSSVYLNVQVKQASVTNRLRVLSIGNSFSEDAMEYLYDIAKSAGIEDVVVGYLYRGGGPLEYHWTTYQNKTTYERFMINDNGTWRRDAATQSTVAIIKYEWDVITFQQASGLSGMTETFEPYLTNLINAIRKDKLSDTDIVWHSTWAYSKTSSHSDFPNYDRDQDKMYQAIINAAKVTINENSEFRTIIPAGTAVQNTRVLGIAESFVTRDGYHLHERFGRYVAGLMWFRQLTGLSLDLVTFVPSSNVGTPYLTDDQVRIAKEAVNQAYETPFHTIVLEN